MPDIVISEFMDQGAVDSLAADYDVVYDPQLVDRRRRLGRHSVRGRVLALIVGLSFVSWPLAAGAGPLEDAIPSDRDARISVSAREILERALDNLYGCDLSQQVELVTSQNGKAVRRHEVTLMRKRIRGRAHTLYDYTMNNELYGFRALRVERADGVVDRFLFLPELLRVRRLKGAGRPTPIQLPLSTRTKLIRGNGVGNSSGSLFFNQALLFFHFLSLALGFVRFPIRTT